MGIMAEAQKFPPLIGALENTPTHLNLYEAQKCLIRLSLRSVTLRDYLIIMRDDFDVDISGEPYVAYILLYHPKSGLYLARVWNQTVASGYATNAQQLQNACSQHFSQGRPCIGCPLRDQSQDGERFLISQSPMPRMISKRCQGVVGENGNSEMTSCRDCLDLDERPNTVEATTAAINSTGVEPSDFVQTGNLNKSDEHSVMKQEPWSYDDYFDSGDQDMANCSKDSIKSQMPDLSEATADNDGICLIQEKRRYIKKKERNLVENAFNSNVKCPWCDEVFPWGSGLLTLHKRICHFFGSFRCKDCPFKAAFARDLVDHVNREGHSYNSHHCPSCREKFTLLGMEDHLPECKAAHCPVCLSSQFTTTEIFDHYKRCVKEYPLLTKKGYYKCSKCQVKFYPAEYFLHALDCDGLKPSYLPPQSSYDYFDSGDQGMEDCSGSPVKCQWCEETFAAGSGLLAMHQKIKHLMGSFKCTNGRYSRNPCKFRASFISELQEHLEKSGHCSNPEIKIRFNCPKCRDMFSLSELESHFAECRSVSCPVCMQHFSESEIGGHFKTCVGEAAAQTGSGVVQTCDGCQKRFSVAELYQHLDLCERPQHAGTHPEEGEKPWNYCWKTRDETPGIGNVAKVGKCQIKLAKSFKGSVSCLPIKSKSGKPVVLKVLKGANIAASSSGNGPKVVMLKGAMWKKNVAQLRGSEYSISQRKKVKCTWCNEVMFQNRFDFHKKRKHLWGEFRCPECGAESFFAQDLIQHIKHHENLKEEGKETLAECPICQKTYSFELLEAHYKSCVAEKVRNVICDFCSKPVHVTKERTHNLKHHRYYGTFECSTCRVQCDFAKDIVAHIESTGHGDGLIRCPLCKGKYPVPEIDKHCDDCVAHRRADMDRRSPAMCSQCGKQYTTREKLNQHVKSMHPADGVIAKHPCDRCGKVFHIKDHLRSHIRKSHEGVDKVPIPCSICNKVLPKSSMKTHLRKEHGVGKEELQCSECGFITETRDGLSNHMKSHQEPQFQCRFCEKKLKTRANLIAHERQHTGEKPFSCQICSAAFAARSSLGQHMRGVHKIAPKGGKTGWYRKEKKAKIEIDQFFQECDNN